MFREALDDGSVFLRCITIPSSTTIRADTLTMFQKCNLPNLARQACRNSATPSFMPTGLHALRIRSFTNSSLRRVQDDGTVTPSAATATNPVEHSPSSLNEAEQAIKDKLKSGFEGAKVDVQDVSGGCGTFYAISLAHPSFKGLSTIKQHQQVNKLLSEEIKSWHGLQVRFILALCGVLAVSSALQDPPPNQLTSSL